MLNLNYIINVNLGIDYSNTTFVNVKLTITKASTKLSKAFKYNFC